MLNSWSFQSWLSVVILKSKVAAKIGCAQFQKVPNAAQWIWQFFNHFASIVVWHQWPVLWRRSDWKMIESAAAALITFRHTKCLWWFCAIRFRDFNIRIFLGDFEIIPQIWFKWWSFFSLFLIVVLPEFFLSTIEIYFLPVLKYFTYVVTNEIRILNWRFSQP